MSDDELEREEAGRVRIWRERCLVDLGWSPLEAMELVAADVDHHQAEHLVRNLGYTPAQAWELLR